MSESSIQDSRALAQSRPSFAEVQAQGYTPTPEECRMAFASHVLGALPNLFCPLLAAFAPLLIRARVKQKTPFILFHLNQAVIFQATLLAILVLTFLVVSLIGQITCGFGYILYVFCFLPPLAGFVYPLMLAPSAKRGEWKAYEWIGEKIFKTRNPIIR